MRTFLRDARAGGCELTHIAFGADGAAWVCSARGLLHYDGIDWRCHDEAEGVPAGRLRCALLAADGELWLGTTFGAGRWRGRAFVPLPALHGRSVRRIHADPDGALWFCCERDERTGAEGGVIRWRKGEARCFGAADSPALASVHDLLWTSDGRCLLATADGVVELAGERAIARPPSPPGSMVVALAELEPGVLVASTRAGLFVGAAGKSWDRVSDRGALPLARTRDGYCFTFTGDQDGRYRLIDVEGPVPLSGDGLHDCGDASALVEAPDGALWAVGNGTLVRWGRTDDDFRILGHLPPPCGEDAAGEVWLAGGGRVYGIRGQEVREHRDVAPPVRVSDNGEVWARDARGDGLIRRRGDASDFYAPPGLLAGRSNLRLEANAAELLALGTANDARLGVWHFDGAAWRRLDGAIPASASLGELAVASDPRGGFWLAAPDVGGASLCRITAAGAVASATPNVPARRVDFAVAGDGAGWLVADGTLWHRPAGAGEWAAAGPPGAQAVWLATARDRLLLGLRCADGSFAVDLLGPVGWSRCPLPPAPGFRPLGDSLVGSANRVFALDGDGVPRAVSLPPTADARVALRSRSGEVWVGTDHGVVRARPLPGTPVARVGQPRSRVTEGERVWLPVRIASPARGIMPPRACSHRVRVDGGAWGASLPLEEEIELPPLAAGLHEIEVQVEDAFGRRNAPPARLRLDVLPLPLQRRDWFPWAVAGVALTILVLLGHALHTRRQLRLRADRLGEIVGDRTEAIRVELRRRTEVEATLRLRDRMLTLLTTGCPLDEAMATLVQGLEGMAPDWRGVLCRVDNRREIHVLAAPSLPLEFRTALHGGRVEPGVDPCRECVWRGETLAIEALAGDGWSASFATLRERLGLAACCARPLVTARGEVIGVLCLYGTVPGPLPAELVEALDAAVKAATLAVERFRQEEEHRRLEAQMQEAQRLESLGLLAGGIAHDFNNILTGILGNAGIARGEAGQASQLAGTLAKIELAAQRAAGLCTQLLAYSGRGRFVVQSIDVSALVREMTQLLQLSLAGKHELVLDLADDLPPVEGDATQLGQVVMNLLTNAREAIGERAGVIAIRTGVVELDHERILRAAIGNQCRPGRHVMLEVSDSGVGMDEATLRSIFEPFFTTKFTGRGLGLAAVHGIVRGHRGAMEIESALGTGSTFRMFLPVSSKPCAARPPAPARPAVAGHGTVLVVDDERCVLDVSRGVLTAAGFTVLTATDGAEAVATFTARQDEIRLVVLDLILPRLGGGEVLAAMRQRAPAVPVILSSGYDLEDPQCRELTVEHCIFLKKPYGPDELLAAVRAALSLAAT